MQIKIHHLFIFISVIVTATILVFPDKHYIIEKMIESGRLELAREYIKRFTTKNPDDMILFVMSSDIYLIEGRADKAIDSLLPFLRRKNVSKQLLLRLAKLYEWERDPRNARVVLERISEVFPNDVQVWNRLIGYYRYLGMMGKEAQAIVALSRLNHLTQKSDPVLSIIDKKLFDLAERYTKSPDEITLFLLSKLNVVRNNYYADAADQNISQKDKLEAADYAIMRIIELYVYSDLFNVIKSFASIMDQQLDSKHKFRLTLIEVMRWADMDNEAITYLWELHEKHPKQIVFLEQILKISRENGDLLTAINALQQLLQMHPNKQDYGNQMAQLFIEAEKYTDAVQLYKQLMHRFPNKDYASLLLKTALHSGKKELMLEAANEIQSMTNKSPEMIKQLVEIYLGLEKIQLAFNTSLKYLSSIDTPEKNDLKKMIEIAIWTNTPKNIRSAISLMHKYLKDDAELITLCGDAYLVLNEPQEAFLLYGKVIHLKHKDRDFMLKYLDIASYTQRPEIMSSAALTASKLAQKDYDVIEKSVQLLQWTNQSGKAFDIFNKWLQINGGTASQAQKLLTLAKESGDSDKMRKAVDIMRTHVSRDPKIQLTIAQEAIASGLTHEAIFAYEAYLRHEKKDADVQRKLADLYVADGQTEKAFQMYRQLFERFPQDSMIREKLIQLAGWTQNASAIAYLVTEKANAAPSDYSLQIKAGDACIAAAQTKESIVFFERALTIKPYALDIRRKLAQYYGWLEQYDDRIRILESIQQYGRLTQSERIQVAQAAMDRKQPDKVISLFTPLYKRKLLSETSGILLAQAFQQKGQNEKSIQIYKQLAEQYQDDSQLLGKMGNQILWMQNQEMALSFFKKALDQDSKNLDALKGSAQIYAWKNKYKQAVLHFNRYLKINPNDYEVRYQLAELLYAKGQKQDAFKHYQKALSLIDRKKRLAQIVTE
jgi:tetratricopeptide (TPR) repeat protein